jgi:queuine tRNA-ribosyltransferase
MKDEKVNASQKSLSLPHGRLFLPIFMPDATFGVVRSVDSADLIRCDVRAVVMNTFHLMQRPGPSVIQRLGGLHLFSDWPLPIVTDSGGFQAYSLIRRNSKFGSLTNKGIVFRPEGSFTKHVLTPEKSIQHQINYGSDILICLDDCTHVSEPLGSQRQSVARTVNWARRCKNEFQRRIEHKFTSKECKPLLFAVVQGGGSYELRKECAEALLEIGFDGFAYGGYPLDSNGELLIDMIKYTRDLIPDEFPMIALGVGQPGNVAKCAEVGYQFFDSSMPTRDARQGRLYRFEKGLAPQPKDRKDVPYSYVYLQDRKHSGSKGPISPSCDCLACTNLSLAYLHHLFRMHDALYFRLATIHNLRFMMLLMKHLREDAVES